MSTYKCIQCGFTTDKESEGMKHENDTGPFHHSMGYVCPEDSGPPTSEETKITMLDRIKNDQEGSPDGD